MGELRGWRSLGAVVRVLDADPNDTGSSVSLLSHDLLEWTSGLLTASDICTAGNIS